MYRPKWVKQNGTLYQGNNAYMITGFDGLDPIFSRLDELLVIGGDIIVYITTVCEVSYFDPHYHAYVISITPQQSMFAKLQDHNVYHGHKLSD